jgi:hypothetical protein
VLCSSLTRSSIRVLELTGEATARPAMLMRAMLIKCMIDSASGGFVASSGYSDDDSGSI